MPSVTPYPLFVAVGDPAFRQVVRSELDRDPIARQNADVMLAHLAGDVRGYDVAIIQFNAKHCVGEGFDNVTIHLDMIFFCHAYS